MAAYNQYSKTVCDLKFDSLNIYLKITENHEMALDVAMCRSQPM